MDIKRGKNVHFFIFTGGFLPGHSLFDKIREFSDYYESDSYPTGKGDETICTVARDLELLN